MFNKIKELVKKHPFNYSKMIKKNLDLYKFVNDFPGIDLKEKVYSILQGCKISHECKNCQKLTPFISIEKGYREYCDAICQKKFLKIEHEFNAIKGVNSFGNFKYISGYDGSYSKIKVKNNNCGCIFDVTYRNLFTNLDYCPVHGVQKRTRQLLEVMKDGLSVRSKKKRKITFDQARAKKIEKIKFENDLLEDELLSLDRDSIIEFITVIIDQHKSKYELILIRFLKLYKIIKKHYGDRFGQKVYNYIQRIDDIKDHPKCLECRNLVNYKSSSNRYNTFCSKRCKTKSLIVKDKMKDTQFKKYGSWHTSTEASKLKKEATNLIRYSASHCLQNKEVLQKVWASQYRLKPTLLPSGRVIQLMGYEPQVLNYLLNIENYDEADFEFDIIPKFRYADKKLYFPDFYLPDQNLIIEVKSQWTLQNALEVTKLKQEAVEAAGYSYRLIVWDNKKNGEIYTES